MILPNPVEIKWTEKHPMTWALVVLNVLLFQLFFFPMTSQGTKDKGVSVETVQTAARLYHQYYSALPEDKKLKEPKWIATTSLINENHLDLVGTYALRNRGFINYLYTAQPFVGDQVLIEKAKNEMKEVEAKLSEQQIYQFGLSSSHRSWVQFIGYQFSHAGYLHLISNMVFLLFIGLAVESLVGSVGLFFLYLCGGIIGGLFFLHYNAEGIVPMVGASAAVSCLIAFYAFAQTAPRIRYFYFIFPSQDFMGYIYLPTLLLIPLFVISDFASLIGTPEGMGAGIAFSAHVGGAVIGSVLGLIKRAFLQKAHESVS